jgi:hypothetical protein
MKFSTSEIRVYKNYHIDTWEEDSEVVEKEEEEEDEEKRGEDEIKRALSKGCQEKKITQSKKSHVPLCQHQQKLQKVDLSALPLTYCLLVLTMSLRTDLYLRLSE